MLTALIVCGADSAPLVPTFGALLPASVEGLVADVIVASPDPDAMRPACEPVGALSVAAHEAGAALGDARGRWVLVLEAGAKPVGQWVPVLAAHVASGSRAGRFEVAGRGEPFWQRLVGRAHRPLRSGFVMPRDEAVEALRVTTPARLPIGRTAVTLRATLDPAG